MVWPCWQPEVHISGSPLASHQDYFEHLFQMQIPGPHCELMALWVFSGLVLRAVSGNHGWVFTFPASSGSLWVALWWHAPLTCLILQPLSSPVQPRLTLRLGNKWLGWMHLRLQCSGAWCWCAGQVGSVPEQATRCSPFPPLLRVLLFTVLCLPDTLLHSLLFNFQPQGAFSVEFWGIIKNRWRSWRQVY